MTNDLILNVNAGGIFSKFMFVIQNACNINPNFNSIYVNNIDNRSLTGLNNIFDLILDQDIVHDGITYDCKHLGNYSKFNPIEKSLNINKYKDIVRKIRFKKSLIDRINYYANQLDINDSFIGLHIRLCDMNVAHARNYGILSFNDYLVELKKHISNDTKIFVASDNYESLDKLKKEFKDRIVYIPDFIRGLKESDDTAKLQLDHFKDSKFWEEAFIEMIILSKCGLLICRSSNLSNASIIYSNTIKKIIRL